jgi:2-amino-4-hydroxy-6-hydroxymethyldihydropteridine diphosphokinase
MVDYCAGEPDPCESVYIGLGANLDHPRRQVERAVAELAELASTRLVAVSRLYRTAPVGPADQPDFVNAVACLQTRLEPLALLAELQRIERRHGRIRNGRRWGPRTLDLDILLFGHRTLDAPMLSVPHPQMHWRAFVLVPLAEIAPPGLVIPGRGCLDRLLADLDQAARTMTPLIDEEEPASGARRAVLR